MLRLILDCFNNLKALYRKEQFSPSWLGVLINPFYFARKNLFQSIMPFAAEIRGVVIDVGCGSKPYQSLFLNADDYIGLDIENSGHNHHDEQIDMYFDGVHLPFESQQIDSAVCFQVLEHAFYPHKLLSEINRVLKANTGVLLLTVPFIWDEHEKPVDYARYTSFGLKHLLRESGFKSVESRKSTADITAVFQMWNNYVYKKIWTRSAILNLFFTLIFIAPVNIFGALLAKILPKNDDLYLDNVIIARK